jgi:predicted phosphate transport protein (TIGR00153 family)
MLTEKEKKVKELMEYHVEKVGGCLECFKGCFLAFLKNDLETSDAIHKNCDYAETEADILRRKIGDQLYSGAFLPIERKDIYILSEAIDKIANKAETASDLVVFQTPEIPELYKDHFQKIADIIEKMFRFFEESIILFAFDDTLGSAKDLATIRENISSIGILESEIDKEEEFLLRNIFQSDLTLSHKLQMEGFVRRVTDISDVIEDAADRLYILVISEKI